MSDTEKKATTPPAEAAVISKNEATAKARTNSKKPQSQKEVVKKKASLPDLKKRISKKPTAELLSTETDKAKASLLYSDHDPSPENITKESINLFYAIISDSCKKNVQEIKIEIGITHAVLFYLYGEKGFYEIVRHLPRADALGVAFSSYSIGVTEHNRNKVFEQKRASLSMQSEENIGFSPWIEEVNCNVDLDISYTPMRGLNKGGMVVLIKIKNILPLNMANKLENKAVTQSHFVGRLKKLVASQSKNNLLIAATIFSAAACFSAYEFSHPSNPKRAANLPDSQHPLYGAKSNDSSANAAIASVIQDIQNPATNTGVQGHSGDLSNSLKEKAKIAHADAAVEAMPPEILEKQSSPSATKKSPISQKKIKNRKGKKKDKKTELSDRQALKKHKNKARRDRPSRTQVRRANESDYDQIESGAPETNLIGATSEVVIGVDEAGAPFTIKMGETHKGVTYKGFDSENGVVLTSKGNVKITN